MVQRYLVLILFLLVFVVGSVYPVGAVMNVTWNVEPRVIQIGAFYNGQQISIRGSAPADSEVVVRVTGKSKDLELKKKGRVLGFFWMNLGTITFEHVPDVYLIYTAKSLANRTQRDLASSELHKIGFEAIEKEAEISVNPCEKHILFAELIKLKESEGLYGIHNDAIRYDAGKGPMKTFSGSLWLPPRLPTGQYTIDVFALNAKEILGQADEKLLVEQVGFPAFLASLAFNHGAIYGVVATLVATAAGLITSIIFKGSKGAH